MSPRPYTLRLLGRMGIPYRMVKNLTCEERGISPGDVAWDGQTMIIEHACPDEWLIHEIGHWIEAHSRNAVGLKNWGLEDCPYEEGDRAETRASKLNLLLMRALGFKSGHVADVADELNVFVERRTSGPQPFDLSAYREWVAKEGIHLLSVPGVTPRIKNHALRIKEST